MKVYGCPIPLPETDYRNYDRDKEAGREDEHRAAVKKWLVNNGYTGKRTGETVTFPVADGHAEYMLGEGRKSILIHLPYCDGYQYRDVCFLPKAEIIRRIDAGKRFAEIFRKKGAA